MKPCATRIFSLPQNHSCHSPFGQSHQEDGHRSPPTISVLHTKDSKSGSCSAMSDSSWPHGLYSPWNSPGQNTGEGRLFLLQGIFPTQGLNPGLPHCRWILFQLSHKGSPRILEWVSYSSSVSSRPRYRTGSPALQVDSLPTELKEVLLNINGVLLNSHHTWQFLVSYLTSCEILLLTSSHITLSHCGNLRLLTFWRFMGSSFG